MSAVPNAARIRFADLPHGARGYLVDCDLEYTRTDAPAETVAILGDDAIGRITAYRHAAECGRCDLSPVFYQVGGEPESDEELRQIWAQTRQVAAKWRRN